MKRGGGEGSKGVEVRCSGGGGREGDLGGRER